MTGRVCERHGEYAPDGVCKWCEPEPATITPVVGIRLPRHIIHPLNQCDVCKVLGGHEDLPAPAIPSPVAPFCRCGQFQLVPPANGWLDGRGRAHSAERCT